MQIKCLVVGISLETWFKGTRDERQVKQLNLLDCDTQCQMKETFDYTPSEEELKLMEPEALRMGTISLGVTQFAVNNGRLRVARGKIDVGTIPPSARKGTTAPTE